MTDHAAIESPVEQLLDGLLVLLPGTPRAVRTALAEAEAHLAEDVDRAIERGLSREDAELQAVRRFGPPELVAADERRWRRAPAAQIVRAGALTACYLGAVAGLAVGASGLVAGLMGRLGGSTLIVDISPATHLAASDCARWLSNDPQASSCYHAALSDWAGETVFYRIAVGILALVALLVLARIRRRAHRHDAFALLPPLVVATIGVTAFAAAGAWLLAKGVDALLTGANGAGQWLSAAPVALAFGGWFAVGLVRELRTLPRQPGIDAPA
jgi:hypothetical protein